MTKKFSFNFKFFDRFKKNRSDHDQLESDQVEPISDSDNHSEEQHQEFNPTEKKFSFNFKFLDKLKHLSHKNEELATDEEINDDNRTVTTTSALSKSLEESERDNDSKTNFPPIPKSELSYSEYDSAETPEEFAEKTLSGFNLNQFQEFKRPDEQPPEKPGTLKIFKLKFPRFDSKELAAKFKKGFKNKTDINSLEKFSWNDFILRIFSPYSRKKVHSIFIILLVITFTYMVGKNLALLFTKPSINLGHSNHLNIPMERIDTTSQDINKITSTNLFNAKESDKANDSKKIKDIDSIICITADQPTNTQIKLLDTIVLQDSVKSVASVQVRGNDELMNVREGEKVENIVEISKIERMRLILKNLQTGDCEYVASDNEDLPMPPLKILSPDKGKSLFKSLNPDIKNVGNNFKIKKAYRDSMVNKMSEVLTQAKAVQITNPDGSLCFKMTEVVPGSIYTQLNIQENDIVCNLNGRKIDNLNELMSLLGRIKEIDQFQIGLKRNGMNENLEYSFE